MNMDLDALKEALDPQHVSYRIGSRGKQVPYIEGHLAISQANRIFGYDGWGYETMSVERLEDYGYMARVRVTVTNTLPREDVGFTDFTVKDGKVIINAGEIDKAMKGAVTDALKRALRSFGDQFGNALYDKDAAQSPSEAPQRPQPAQSQAPARSEAPRPQGDDEWDNCLCGKRKKVQYPQCYECKQAGVAFDGAKTPAPSAAPSPAPAGWPDKAPGGRGDAPADYVPCKCGRAKIGPGVPQCYICNAEDEGR